MPLLLRLFVLITHQSPGQKELMACDHCAVSVAELSALKFLWLDGNPLSYAPFYRLDVLAWFETSQLCLDGRSPKSSESTAVAMRATGEVPLAWHIMAQYVSQQHLLWRPKKARHTCPRLLHVLWSSLRLA